MHKLSRRPCAHFSSLALVLVACVEQSSLSETATPAQFQREFAVTEGVSEDFATQLSEQLEIVLVSDIPASGLENGVVNPSQTLAAFDWCDEHSCRILV